MCLVPGKCEIHSGLLKSLFQIIKMKCFKAMHSFWDCSRRTNNQHVQNYCSTSHHVVFFLIVTPAFLCMQFWESFGNSHTSILCFPVQTCLHLFIYFNSRALYTYEEDSDNLKLAASGSEYWNQMLLCLQSKQFLSPKKGFAPSFHRAQLHSQRAEFGTELLMTYDRDLPRWLRKQISF